MSELIRREDALEIVKRTGGDYATAFSEISKLPAVDAVEVGKVAQMFWELTGDDCPCNYNDNDEWLWNFCDGDHCPGEGLECWKLFVKHYRSEKMEYLEGE